MFDLTGRAVATLVDGAVEAGRHQVRFDAGWLASGTYLARRRSGGAVQGRALVLLK